MEITEQSKLKKNKSFFLRPFYINRFTRAAIALVTVFAVFVCCALGFSDNIKTVYIVSNYETVPVTLYGNAKVRDAFNKSGIILSLDDKISPELDRVLSDGETITAVYAENDSLKLPAAAQINFVTDLNELGTLVVTNSGDVLEYKQKITMSASAYCPCSICCGPYDGSRTANGSPTVQGYTVATSSKYAFGTMFYIPYFDGAGDDGIFEVEDRGGAIVADRIDIFFNTHEAALKFGRKTLTVYVLKQK